MRSIERYGRTLLFDDGGLCETPYVYGPLDDGQVYEESFLQHIRDLGRVGGYVDAGAHLGTHTVWFALLCPSTHVHAFEPVARYADRVRRNVAANGLQHKVTVHRLGLADRRGRARNQLSREHQIGFAARAEAVEEEFPVRRLDRVVRGPVAVLKLDVEGMETAVLRGAARILRRDRPVVFAEAFTPEDAAAVGDLLASYGYVATGRRFNATPTYEFAVPPPLPGATVSAPRRARSPADRSQLIKQLWRSSRTR